MNTKKLLGALYIIFSVFIIGLTSPVLVSAFITITTETKFSECVESFPFWLFTVGGWILGALYVADEV
jgi:uncharacterized membrane protein YdcZ (DUF606 family)